MTLGGCFSSAPCDPGGLNQMAGKYSCLGTPGLKTSPTSDFYLYILTPLPFFPVFLAHRAV